MLRILLQFIVISCLAWSSLVFSEPIGPPPEYQAEAGLQFVSKTFSFGNYTAIVKAESFVDIDSLISEEMKSTKNLDKFLAGFERERLARYPDEEIYLKINNTKPPSKAGTFAPQAVSGTLQNALAYGFNVTRYYNQGWAYYNTGYGFNGVITYLNTRAGSLYLYHRQRTTSWVYRGTSSWNSASTFSASTTGYDGYYGSYAVCKATICTFNIISYLLY